MVVMGVGKKDPSECIQPEIEIPRLGEIVGTQIDDRLVIQKKG